MQNSISSFFSKFSNISISHLELVGLIKQAKYKIILLIIISVICNILLYKNFKPIYKLTSIAIPEDFANLSILHQEMEFLSNNYIKVLKTAGWEIPSSVNFNTVYKSNYFDFINLYLHFINSETIYRLRQKNIFANINTDADNSYDKQYSNVFELLNPREKYYPERPLFILEMYSKNRKDLIKDFKIMLLQLDDIY